MCCVDEYFFFRGSFAVNVIFRAACVEIIFCVCFCFVVLFFVILFYIVFDVVIFWIIIVIDVFELIYFARERFVATFVRRFFFFYFRFVVVLCDFVFIVIGVGDVDDLFVYDV